MLYTICLPLGLMAGYSLPASPTLLVSRANVQAALGMKTLTGAAKAFQGVVVPTDSTTPSYPDPPPGCIWAEGFEGIVCKQIPNYVAPIPQDPLPTPQDPLQRLDFGSFDTKTTTISTEEVLTAQANWAKAITTISAVYAEGGDFVGMAGAAAGELYGYGHTDVLFKPTKATDHPFRPTGEEAMSYFVGAEAMGADEFKGEDAGFAINGGRGWKSVVFRNHQIECYGDVAHAMGDYIFVDATSGDEVRVEYTFAYKRNDDGKVRICLHHSSVPYKA